jgi:hypothetical protein
MIKVTFELVQKRYQANGAIKRFFNLNHKHSGIFKETKYVCYSYGNSKTSYSILELLGNIKSNMEFISLNKENSNIVDIKKQVTKLFDCYSSPQSLTQPKLENDFIRSLYEIKFKVEKMI